jgi:hypothetical protein
MSSVWQIAMLSLVLVCGICGAATMLPPLVMLDNVDDLLMTVDENRTNLLLPTAITIDTIGEQQQHQLKEEENNQRSTGNNNKY